MKYMLVKEDLKKGKYRGFIYVRGDNDEIGIDFHEIDPDTEKAVGRTKQICLFLGVMEIAEFMNKKKAVKEARMDQDIINAKAVYEAGWKGYKKAIERAIELVEEEVFSTTLFANKIPTSKTKPIIILDLQKELKQTTLMLEGDKSPEALPAGMDAKIL